MPTTTYDTRPFSVSITTSCTSPRLSPRALRTSMAISSLTRTSRTASVLAGACAAVARSVRCIVPARVLS
jgi:hypothetical protein